MYILKRQFVQLKINNMLQLLYPKQRLKINYQM